MDVVQAAKGFVGQHRVLGPAIVNLNWSSKRIVSIHGLREGRSSNWVGDVQDLSRRVVAVADCTDDGAGWSLKLFRDHPVKAVVACPFASLLRVTSESAL